jgi:hypothetical protein
MNQIDDSAMKNKKMRQFDDSTMKGSRMKIPDQVIDELSNFQIVKLLFYRYLQQPGREL